MSTTESQMEILKSILNDFANKYEKQITEINSLVTYKKWAYTGSYQTLLTIDELKTLIEKYGLSSVDPRTIEEFINEYNEKEWFKYFPVYDQKGKYTWHKTDEIKTIIDEFLKQTSKNNVQNFVDFLSNNQKYLYTISSALIWNKLEYVATVNNVYMFKPNLFEGTYEDGNIIGTLARNNQDESTLVICLSNLVNLLNGYLNGKTDSSNLLVANTAIVRAACNYQFNSLNLTNGKTQIKTIVDFWNSNIGKNFKEPFESLTDQKQIQKIKNDQKQMETEIINAMKFVNLSNSSISICNMTQNISGAILALDSSKISLSQECTQTSEQTVSISNKLTTIENELAVLKSDTITDHSERIKVLEEQAHALIESSYPKIIMDVRDKINKKLDNLYNKHPPQNIMGYTALIAIVLLTILSVALWQVFKDIGKGNEKVEKKQSDKHNEEHTSDKHEEKHSSDKHE